MSLFYCQTETYAFMYLQYSNNTAFVTFYNLSFSLICLGVSLPAIKSLQINLIIFRFPIELTFCKMLINWITMHIILIYSWSSAGGSHSSSIIKWRSLIKFYKKLDSRNICLSPARNQMACFYVTQNMSKKETLDIATKYERLL